MNKKHLRFLLVIIFIALIAAFFAFDLGRFFNFQYLQSQKEVFSNYYDQNKWLTLGAYFCIYVIVTALSLPGAALLTLLAGALFGIYIGTILVSFASTIGATLAFLSVRFVLRDSVQEKFGDKLKTINEGVKKEGGFYLFALRLVPAFPFFLVNMVMGLTPIKVITFYIVSQIGMLAGTIVYVNAGTQFGQLTSLKGILSPEILLSFTLLGIFPFIAKYFLSLLQQLQRGRKTLGKFKKPRNFDYNLVVIGAGSAGLVTSYIAAALKAKVALIERHKMGGDCLNTGCVPSKALIRSAKVLATIKRHEEFALNQASASFDFAKVMERVQNVIQKIEPHDSVERYTQLGVECINGSAKIKSPYEVEVNGKVLTTKNIVVATGARPFVPPIPGIDQVGILTSDNVWDIRELPKKLVVLGGGPIGCELAQSFARFGSEVTMIERSERIMAREDLDVSDVITKKYQKEGIKLLVSHNAKEFKNENGQKTLICEHNGQDVRVDFDQCIMAIGRKPNTEGFGLEELGVEISPRGTIAADEFLATNFPNIFVCGDVAGPYQFTHTAAHQAYYACVNSLFRPLNYFMPGFLKKKFFEVDYRVIPWATFSDPEVATVGLTETAAKQKDIAYELTTYGIDDLDRAIADGDDNGFVKVLTAPGSDKVIGATIVHARASDLITEFILAMKMGFGLNAILGTIHPYPTLSEANKFLAGNWKRARKPENILEKLGKFHAWRRG